MAQNDFRRFMAPDFQASQQPALDWMPWEQDTTQQDMSNIVGQLKPRQQTGGPMTKGGMMPGMEGKDMLGGTGGKGSL